MRTFVILKLKFHQKKIESKFRTLSLLFFNLIDISERFSVQEESSVKLKKLDV